MAWQSLRPLQSPDMSLNQDCSLSPSTCDIKSFVLTMSAAPCPGNMCSYGGAVSVKIPSSYLALSVDVRSLMSNLGLDFACQKDIIRQLICYDYKISISFQGTCNSSIDRRMDVSVASRIPLGLPLSNLCTTL